MKQELYKPVENNLEDVEVNAYGGDNCGRGCSDIDW